MAQKRDKEETELKVPETLSLRPSPSSHIPVSSPPSQLSAFSRPDPNLPSDDGYISSSIHDRTPERSNLDSSHKKKTREMNLSRPLKRSRDGNRCSGPDCKRKIGLMGFRCRCGDMFCSDHRYSDRHGCSFDYKAAGREAIARENPVVKASKILKV